MKILWNGIGPALSQIGGVLRQNREDAYRQKQFEEERAQREAERAYQHRQDEQARTDRQSQFAAQALLGMRPDHPQAAVPLTNRAIEIFRSGVVPTEGASPYANPKAEAAANLGRASFGAASDALAQSGPPPSVQPQPRMWGGLTGGIDLGPDAEEIAQKRALEALVRQHSLGELDRRQRTYPGAANFDYEAGALKALGLPAKSYESPGFQYQPQGGGAAPESVGGFPSAVPSQRRSVPTALDPGAMLGKSQDEINQEQALELEAAREKARQALEQQRNLNALKRVQYQGLLSSDKEAERQAGQIYWKALEASRGDEAEAARQADAWRRSHGVRLPQDAEPTAPAAPGAELPSADFNLRPAFGGSPAAPTVPAPAAPAGGRAPLVTPSMLRAQTGADRAKADASYKDRRLGQYDRGLGIQQQNAGTNAARAGTYQQSVAERKRYDDAMIAAKSADRELRGATSRGQLEVARGHLKVAIDKSLEAAMKAKPSAVDKAKWDLQVAEIKNLQREYTKADNEARADGTQGTNEIVGNLARRLRLANENLEKLVPKDGASAAPGAPAGYSRTTFDNTPAGVHKQIMGEVARWESLHKAKATPDVIDAISKAARLKLGL